MTHSIDILREAKKQRLLADLVPILGDDRMIVIGAPAEVARLLEVAPVLTAPALAPQLRSIGSQMANLLYNLAQHVGKPVERKECPVMDQLRRQRDSAAHQQRGPAPALSPTTAAKAATITKARKPQAQVRLCSAFIGNVVRRAQLDREVTQALVTSRPVQALYGRDAPVAAHFIKLVPVDAAQICLGAFRVFGHFCLKHFPNFLFCPDFTRHGLLLGYQKGIVA